ncbi:hypothetical protein AOLI_G00170630 [Acnodon oligacanthus]
MMQQLILLIRAQSEGTQPASASAGASGTTPVSASPLPPTDPNPVQGDALVANPERYARDPETCRGLFLGVQLSWGSTHHTTLQALVDSGAAESFLDVTLATELGLPFKILERLLPVTAINGHSLESGPVTHRTGPLTLRCDSHCLADPCPSHKVTFPTGPARPDLTGVPKEYWDPLEVFNKEKAQVLLPHRVFDCAINLLLGATTPCG